MGDKIRDLIPNMVQVEQTNSISCLDLYHSLVDNTAVVTYCPHMQKET